MNLSLSVHRWYRPPKSPILFQCTILMYITLSINPWCIKNSGEAAESKEHIVPSIKQWTTSWKLTRRPNSNELKSFGCIFSSWVMAMLSGGWPLKNLLRHLEGPADGTSVQAPCLKTPLWTQPVGWMPLPPNPLFPEYHISFCKVPQGLPETTLQSQ